MEHIERWSWFLINTKGTFIEPLLTDGSYKQNYSSICRIIQKNQQHFDDDGAYLITIINGEPKICALAINKIVTIQVAWL